VLELEVSRLARNSTDWHRLLEICAVTDTLILDEDGIYDPAHFNDRLLLGLKGTMSEAELHIMRARLRGGLINKARRGELRYILPVGLVYGSEDQVVLDPDQQVQQAVRLQQCEGWHPSASEGCRRAQSDGGNAENMLARADRTWASRLSGSPFREPAEVDVQTRSPEAASRISTTKVPISTVFFDPAVDAPTRTEPRLEILLDTPTPRFTARFLVS